MTTYLIEFDDLVSSTEMRAEVDVSRYAFCIENAQDAVLRELLGDTLYDKVETDYKNKALSGLYLTLYNNYVRPILINASMVEYYAVGAYQVAQGGVYKHTPANGQAVEKVDIEYLQKQKQIKVDMYVQRCQKWLFRNMLPEYTWHYNNNVNPTPAGPIMNISYINGNTTTARNIKRYVLGYDSNGNKL